MDFGERRLCLVVSQSIRRLELAVTALLGERLSAPKRARKRSHHPQETIANDDSGLRTIDVLPQELFDSIQTRGNVHRWKSVRHGFVPRVDNDRLPVVARQ